VLVTLRQLPASAPTTAQVEVSDRGPGIPKAAKPRIFERFFVVERDDQDDPAQRRLSTGRASRSHGLGLAIVRSIVLAHGGSVAVRDHPQQGAVFTLDLPLAPPAADKAPAPLPA
jgi:two-component system sensor histidine kinase MtrB